VLHPLGMATEDATVISWDMAALQLVASGQAIMDCAPKDHLHLLRRLDRPKRLPSLLISLSDRTRTLTRITLTSEEHRSVSKIVGRSDSILHKFVVRPGYKIVTPSPTDWDLENGLSKVIMEERPDRVHFPARSNPCCMSTKA
jgi:hypothetical protein